MTEVVALVGKLFFFVVIVFLSNEKLCLEVMFNTVCRCSGFGPLLHLIFFVTDIEEPFLDSGSEFVPSGNCSEASNLSG